jgi:hypothetical protein
MFQTPPFFILLPDDDALGLKYVATIKTNTVSENSAHLGY